MPQIKLTQRVIDRDGVPINQTGEVVIHWLTGDYPGLGVLVTPKNTRTWVVQTHMPDGRKVRTKVGRFEQLRLDAAWELACAKLADIAKGIHPRDEKRRLSEARRAEARTGMTVAQAIEQYLARRAYKASSAKQYRAYVADGGHLAPWAKLRLRDVTPEMVVRRYEAIIADVKSRTHQGGKDIAGDTSANVIMTVFGGAWRWAANGDETLPKCPVWIISQRMKKPDPRTTVVEEDQLPDFYAAAKALPELQSDMVIYALFTGARLQECQQLQWSEVNLPKKTISIAADRMKAGRAHSFPMSDVVYDILARRGDEFGKVGFVFPGLKAHSTALPFALRDIAKSTGIKVTPHDLRRTFVTIAESTEGLSVYQLKKLVAHSAGGRGSDVTSGYIQMQEKRLAEAAQRVANHLKTLCGIGGANVVQLAAKR